MSLVPVKDILKMASDANTSVIAFNCIDYNMIYSVIHAAEKVNKPVLVMLYPEHAELNNTCNPETFAAAVKSVAEEVSVPVGLHLDHCQDVSYIIRAIKAGFSCVMYDGSMLPLEENIENTKLVVKIAHAFGVAVEGELGHVGVAANKSDQANLDLYTKPEVAKKYIEESGADALAVAIGSAHGVYKETPKLDIQRLSEINAAIDTPLVLHGGSGIPNDQLDMAFVNGINKFNVGTEFFHLYHETMRKYTEEHPDGAALFDYPKYAQGILMDYLVKKLELSKF
ncbi:MAG: class II fructose-bisphosphate aldolase [Eubacteriales bacterium]|nr:class II fructose-bisphosphate aldolase [Eubacteriales bacterium]